MSNNFVDDFKKGYAVTKSRLELVLENPQLVDTWRNWPMDVPDSDAAFYGAVFCFKRHPIKTFRAYTSMLKYERSKSNKPLV